MRLVTLEQASDDLDKLIDEVVTQGPVKITNNGIIGAVLVDLEEWKRLDRISSYISRLKTPGPDD